MPSYVNQYEGGLCHHIGLGVVLGAQLRLVLIRLPPSAECSGIAPVLE